MESNFVFSSKMKLRAVSFMKHRGITSTEFDCPATDAVVLEADTTQIEPSPVPYACVHVFAM
jgi:hypothetical protein